MKKLAILLTFLLLTIFCLPACEKPFTLEPFVSELRSDLFLGQSQSYTLKAGYGFKETPFVNDGKVGDPTYALTFRLLDKETDPATYTLSMVYGEQTYTTDFKLNPVKNSLTASIELEDFTKKEFTVTVFSSGKGEQITLSSTLPQNTLSYKDALLHLQKQQSTLIGHYKDDQENFNAELYMRVIVKDQAPYWYIGFASGNEQLKALLIDGTSGELLAIREIF